VTRFHARYEQLQMQRADVVIPMGLGALLIQAVIHAALYPRLFAEQNRARGALAWSLTVLPVAAKHSTASVADFVLLETACTFVHDLVVSSLPWSLRCVTRCCLAAATIAQAERLEGTRPPG
jgi:hypothetical protein